MPSIHSHARLPYACPLKYHCQSFFFFPTLAQAQANTHVQADMHTHTHTRKKKNKSRTRISLLQTPITLHLVCDLIQCIDNLPVSGTQPTDRFQGALLCGALPPRWLGTQTSIRSTRREEERKGRRDLRERDPNGVHWHTLQSPLERRSGRGLGLNRCGYKRRGKGKK